MKLRKNITRLLAICGVLGMTLPANEAEATTTYTSGVATDGTSRWDTISVGAAGDFTGCTTTAGTVKKLFIDIFEVAGATVALNDTVTTLVDFPTTLTEVWIRGDAEAWNTIVTGATLTLPCPPLNCKIHFALTASPAAAAVWFNSGSTLFTANRLTWKIYTEPGSVDPLLLAADMQAVSQVYIGCPMTAAGALTMVGGISKHPSLTTAVALTIAGATTFQGLAGIALNGGGAENDLTFSENATLEDCTNVSTGTLTVAASKTLKVRGSALTAAAMTTVLPATGVITLGSNATINVFNNQ